MFKPTLAGLATLALATIPALALATAVQAAPMKISMSDIDTLTPAGAAAFQDRADAAANKFCVKETANQRGLTAHVRCVEAVKEEIAEKYEARNAILAAKSTSTLASR